jgi:predicted DNA-binding protein
MGKAIRNPRYNVISIRISEEERRHLNNLVARKSMSVSDFMREALEYYATSDRHA